MRISPEKMTYLTSNYGLSVQQVTSFASALEHCEWEIGPEIEQAWEEGGWTPEDPRSAMIECCIDADRLERWIDDYMDWCFDFKYKLFLAHDLREHPIQDKFWLDWLKDQKMSTWMLDK